MGDETLNRFFAHRIYHQVLNKSVYQIYRNNRGYHQFDLTE